MIDDDYRALQSICWEIEQNLLEQAHTVLDREQAVLDAMPIGITEIKLKERCETMRQALDWIEDGVKMLNTVAYEKLSRATRRN
jgi:hypothetical protein